MQLGSNVCDNDNGALSSEVMIPNVRQLIGTLY